MNTLPENFNLNRYGLHVRFVDETDAEFILKLRTDSIKSRFIGATTPDLNKQLDWTRYYKCRERLGEDFYFMFETYGGNRLGVTRVYNVCDRSFDTGSWLFSPDAPVGASILAYVIAREIAFDLFPDKVNEFDVMKANETVWKFDQTFEPTLIAETEDSYRFRNTREEFERNKQKYIKMLAGRMERMCQKYDEQLRQC